MAREPSSVQAKVARQPSALQAKLLLLAREPSAMQSQLLPLAKESQGPGRVGEEPCVVDLADSEEEGECREGRGSRSKSMSGQCEAGEPGGGAEETVESLLAVLGEASPRRQREVLARLGVARRLGRRGRGGGASDSDAGLYSDGSPDEGEGGDVVVLS